MKRSWTNSKAFKPKILAMRAAGKVADELGLNKIQTKNWINRRNKKADREEAELSPKRRGCKPAVTLQEYKYENKLFKMENELLRNFLHVAEGSESCHKI